MSLTDDEPPFHRHSIEVDGQRLTARIVHIADNARKPTTGVRLMWDITIGDEKLARVAASGADSPKSLEVIMRSVWAGEAGTKYRARESER